MAFVSNAGTSYPLYFPRVLTTILPSVTSSTPYLFSMAKGYVTLSIQDPNNSANSFSFSLVGGNGNVNTLATPASALFIQNNSLINCTVTSSVYVAGASTTYGITVGGNTYTFIFYVFPGILPSITLNTGSISGRLIIQSNDRIFSRGI